MIEDIEKIEDRLEYTFSDKSILVQALTHCSFSNENKGEPNNERFEFLGDAVLQFISTVKLFDMYKDKTEGTLSVYRSLVVKTDFLIEIANKLSLQKHIRVSEGQKREMKVNTSTILADTVEAIIGAIYIDGGFDNVNKFINEKVLSDIDEYLKNIPLRDSKTELQEIAQKKSQETPEYVLIDESGPDHDKVFVVGVKIGDKVLAKDKGKSKQIAEQNAAKIALDIIRKDGSV